METGEPAGAPVVSHEDSARTSHVCCRRCACCAGLLYSRPPGTARECAAPTRVARQRTPRRHRTRDAAWSRCCVSAHQPAAAQARHRSTRRSQVAQPATQMGAASPQDNRRCQRGATSRAAHHAPDARARQLMLARRPAQPRRRAPPSASSSARRGPPLDTLGHAKPPPSRAAVQRRAACRWQHAPVPSTRAPTRPRVLVPTRALHQVASRRHSCVAPGPQLRLKRRRKRWHRLQQQKVRVQPLSASPGSSRQHMSQEKGAWFLPARVFRCGAVLLTGVRERALAAACSPCASNYSSGVPVASIQQRAASARL